MALFVCGKNMKQFIILLVASLCSASAFAEKCEGIAGCIDLYSKLTGEAILVNEVKPDMTLALAGTDLTKANAKTEFVKFINTNIVELIQGNKLVAFRHGEFLSSPIYLIENKIIPQMINKDGLVTLVYQSNKDPKSIITRRIRNKLSRKKTKSINNIVEFSANKTVSVSDTYEYASRIMATIIKLDLKK